MKPTAALTQTPIVTYGQRGDFSPVHEWEEVARARRIRSPVQRQVGRVPCRRD